MRRRGARAVEGAARAVVGADVKAPDEGAAR